MALGPAHHYLSRITSTPRPEFTTVQIDAKETPSAQIRTVVNSGLGVMSTCNCDTY